MLNSIKKLFIIPKDSIEDDRKWLSKKDEGSYFASDRVGKSKFKFTKGSKRVIFSIDLMKFLRKKK
jgi:hypothetical protein